MRAELFLSNWSDILGERQGEPILDYEALLSSDDEFLVLTSVFGDEEIYE